MSAALRARVTDGRLVVVGEKPLPEGMEFELVPVPLTPVIAAPAPPANERALTLLDLIGAELPDEAFDVVLARADDLPRDVSL